MKRLGAGWTWGWSALLGGCLLVAPSTWAQQQEESSSQPQQQGAQQAQESSTKAKDGQSTEGKASSGLPAGVEPPPVRQLGGAGPLLSGISRARLGRLALHSFDFFQTYDAIRFNNTSDQSANPYVRRVASILRANIVYDRPFRRSRFALQYTPRFAMVNGKPEDNFSNHNLSFDTYYLLSPRWSLGISDQAAYHNERILFDENVNLDVNLTDGDFVQRYFLDNQGRWISNRAQVTLDYRIGPGTSFSIAPNYTYSNAKDITFDTESHRYGGIVSLDHGWGRDKHFGVFYSAERALFSRDLAATWYESFGFTYSQRPGQTWVFTMSASAASSRLAVEGRHWTANGLFSVGKRFRTSTLTFAYTRGQNYGLHLQNTFSDRVDAMYGVSLTRRFRTDFGAGYYREIWTRRGTWAKYGTVQFSYVLTPTVHVVMNFAHKAQTGDGTIVSGGRRSFAMAGIRWIPARTE